MHISCLVLGMFVSSKVPTTKVLITPPQRTPRSRTYLHANHLGEYTWYVRTSPPGGGGDAEAVTTRHAACMFEGMHELEEQHSAYIDAIQTDRQQQ